MVWTRQALIVLLCAEVIARGTTNAAKKTTPPSSSEWVENLFFELWL